MPSAGGACALHRVHTPKPLTVEWHHVIPVAWQLSTPVANPPFPGMDTDHRGMLWDDRGVSICPTGHRNTHVWIVALMHVIAQTAVDDPAAAWKKVPARVKRMPEAQTALEALTRYTAETRQSLLALTAKGEWGQV